MQKLLQWTGLLAFPVAAYNLYYFKSGVKLSHAVILLVLVLIALGIASIKTRLNVKFASIALLFSVFIYWWFPTIFVDDTGFVIRYLNQASDGCFYCFNASDGPVFGLSGFLYGIAAIIMALPGWLEPETIIHILSFSGLLWLIYISQKIIYEITNSVFTTVLGLSFAMLAASNLLLSVKAGLETCFHLAIVFTAIYFFIKYDRKKLWLFMALSVISKLDAVPIVTVLGIFEIVRNRNTYFKPDWKAWKDVVIYAGVPLVAFIILTFALFGGPLPQSAYAKLYHHAHPSDHWFPFLEFMMQKGEMKALIKFVFVFGLLQAAMDVYNRKFKLNGYLFGILFIATMALYYAYNPAERMIWYYALPEFLLFLQLAVSTYSILTEARFKKLSFIGLIGALSIAAVPNSMGGFQWMRTYFGTVEGERLEIGQEIEEITTESDTLVAAHGHFVANTEAYVIDMSGLNSKLATDHKLEMATVLEKFKPKYAIHHCDDNLLYWANTLNYRLHKAWFNINKYGYRTWTLFQRTNEDGVKLIRASNLLDTSDNNYTLRFPDCENCTVQRVIFGVESTNGKAIPLDLQLGNGAHHKITTQSIKSEPYKPVKTIDIQVDISTGNVFTVPKTDILIYDPFLEIRENKPPDP